MIFRRINRLAPEQVYVSVVNTGADAISENHGVVWENNITGNAPNDGFGVRYAYPNSTTEMDGPRSFAGVADADIPAEGMGLIQVWGARDSVFVTGHAAPQMFEGVPSIWAKADMRDRLLRLPSLYVTTVSGSGLFGAMKCVTEMPVVFSTVYGADKVPGGYLVPMSRVYTAVSTDGSWISGTLAHSSSGFCKVFIRAL